MKSRLGTYSLPALAAVRSDVVQFICLIVTSEDGTPCISLPSIHTLMEPSPELVYLIIEYGRSNSILLLGLDFERLFIEVQLIYNIVLVSGVQQRFTCFTDYTAPTVIVKCYLFSLCCAIYPCSLFILYIVVCIS